VGLSGLCQNFYKMKKILNLIVLISLCCSLPACSFFKKSKVVEKNDQRVLNFDGKVLDFQVLLQSKNLLIVTFKPGPGVAATDETKRLSIRMVSSISDDFKKYQRKFNILTASQAENADLVLKGYITRIENPAGLLNKLRKKKMILEVRGKILDAKSGRIVVDFVSSLSSQNKWDLSDLANQTGKAIANFIFENI